MEFIRGYIERITYQNDENGYTVAKLQESGKRELTCIVGTLPSLQPGETVCCQGEWKQHPVHGRQFVVSQHKTEYPADIAGIQKYLGSGLIKGIGPKYAKKIVDTFGKETLSIIDTQAEKLGNIPGIGKKRVGLIRSCWEDQKAIRDVMIFLQSHGVSPTYAQKIFKRYHNKSIEVVSENPYRLAQDIFGVGFKTADKIAQTLGIDKQSDQRIDAGIEFCLTNLSNEGHVCYPRSLFIKAAAEMLEVEECKVETRIDELVLKETIILQELPLNGSLQPFLWTRTLFFSEIAIAEELKRIRKNPPSLRKIDVPKALNWVQEKLSIKLATNQSTAIGYAFDKKVLIITGGPGTGKSTIIHAILTIADKLTTQILLAAPTGKAAKRMTEITGRKASTIHSLLEYDFKKGGFKKNRENPLKCDVIIVDESSMIDTHLMKCLLRGIPSHSIVIFVGDIDQLPSVGPGNVLKDIISSHVVPVIILNEIFRQAEGSQIITNAHRVNQGRMPDTRMASKSDFYFLQEDEPEMIVQTLVGLITSRLPKKFHLNPMNEIQVLAPMKKGLIGTENLNNVLQEALNPGQESIFRSGRKFASGDKVMQIRNNYDKGVFNGDIGMIQSIDQEDQVLVVNFDETEVSYDFTEIDELVPAYAISVHKYQGSECPCIVMPIHTSHFMLLYRNLLYTAITRGKKLVILVGTKKALAIAVKNQDQRMRFTGLKEALLDRIFFSEKRFP